MPARCVAQLIKMQKFLADAGAPLEELVAASADLDAQQTAIDKLAKQNDPAKMAAARIKLDATSAQLATIRDSVEDTRGELDRTIKQFVKSVESEEQIDGTKAGDEFQRYVRNAKALSRALKSVAANVPE